MVFPGKSENNAEAGLDPIVRLWILRILVPLGGYGQFLQPRHLMGSELCSVLGIDPGEEEDETDTATLLHTLHDQYRTAERAAGKPRRPSDLLANLEQLSSLLGLSPVDCRILEFAITINHERLLNEAAGFLGDLSTVKMYRILATILDIPEPQVRHALSPQGILSASGLLCVDRRSNLELQIKLDMLSTEFADLMNTPDIDPVRLLRGIALTPEPACLGLYGPPGTGKTAYGRWLAQTLDVPLKIRRASDLVSPYVGKSAQNIAHTFHEASHENALLMIDEVDTFLQDRRGTHHTWEVSLINEMLTQMEAFPGFFITSTNLMDGLDQAALHRFDLKVKFDYLQPEQARQLFCQTCQQLQLPPPDAAQQTRLLHQHQLTPGDFATLLRQHRFRPIRSATLLADALEAECALKEGAGNPTGFVHT